MCCWRDWLSFCVWRALGNRLVLVVWLSWLAFVLRLAGHGNRLAFVVWLSWLAFVLRLAGLGIRLALVVWLSWLALQK